jgi:hypothetical protein
MNKILHLGTAIAFCSTALAAEFHVSPAGSDADPGSKAAPLHLGGSGQSAAGGYSLLGCRAAGEPILDPKKLTTTEAQ